MADHEPLDFLLARAASLCAQAVVLRDANARRHAEAERTRQRAAAAVLRARLYAAYAADLVQQSYTLLAERSPVTRDAATRARLAADELWPRRLAKRLRERDSG